MRFDLQSIGGKFDVFGEFIDASPCGNGHINDTFAASYDQGGRRIRYIHQRINHKIFHDPVAQMENIQRVTSHIRKKLKIDHDSHLTRRALTVVPTLQGNPYHRDEEGNYWRTYVMIERTISQDRPQTPEQAYEAAKAVGRFQRLLADLPGEPLHETIPDFHNTPKRVRALKKAIQEDICERAASTEDEIKVALQHEETASRLIDMMEQGIIPERVTHNDTKFNNILIDETTGEALCLIDLDTVMPGSALYDFGDMVRSITNSSREDERDYSKVHIDMTMFDALVCGYLEEAAGFLNDAEVGQLAFSGKLITYETGVRFFTDYLQGDKYFKTKRPGQNLDRTRTHFSLLASMEEHAEAMDACVRTARGK